MRYWLEERKEGDKDEALTASPAASSSGAQAGDSNVCLSGQDTDRLCMVRTEGMRASEYA